MAYFDESVIEDVQDRLANGRLPGEITIQGAPYDRYEVDEAEVVRGITGDDAHARRFKIMDYTTELSYYVTIEQAD